MSEDEWPFAIGSTIIPAVVDVEDVEGPAIILPCDAYPVGAIVPRKGGMPSIHSEPDIVNRLIRMVEELIEREEVDAEIDRKWYWNKLQEIKAEVRHAQNTRTERSSQ